MIHRLRMALAIVAVCVIGAGCGGHSESTAMRCSMARHALGRLLAADGEHAPARVMRTRFGGLSHALADLYKVTGPEQRYDVRHDESIVSYYAAHPAAMLPGALHRSPLGDLRSVMGVICSSRR